MRALLLAGVALWPMAAWAGQVTNPGGGGVTPAQQSAINGAVQRGSSTTAGDPLTYNTVTVGGTSYNVPTLLGSIQTTASGALQRSGDTMIGQLNLAKPMTGTSADQIAQVMNENIAGSGTNGPATSQQGLYIDVQKAGWYAKTAKPGQIEGLRIIGRQGGGTSANGTGGGSTSRADVSTITTNVQCQDDSTGFCNNQENVVTLLHHVSGSSDTIPAGIDTQIGVLDTGAGAGDGYVANCLYASAYCTNGVLVEGAGWANLFQGLNSSGQSVASISGTGLITTAGGLISTAGQTALGTTSIGAATLYSLGVQTTSYFAGAVTAAAGLTSTTLSTSGAATLNSLGVQATTYLAGAVTAAGGLTSTAGATTLGATTATSLSLTGSQPASTVLAAPTGAAGAPTQRQLTQGDIASGPVSATNGTFSGPVGIGGAATPSTGLAVTGGISGDSATIPTITSSGTLTAGGTFRVGNSPTLSSGGTTQATATALGSGSNKATSCTSGAFRLPGIVSTSYSQILYFWNRSGATCTIYPPSGGTIEGGTANASMTVASGVLTIFASDSATDWLHN